MRSCFYRIQKRKFSLCKALLHRGLARRAEYSTWVILPCCLSGYTFSRPDVPCLAYHRGELRGQLHVTVAPEGAPSSSAQPPNQLMCEGGAAGSQPRVCDSSPSPDGRQLKTTLRARLQARTADVSCGRSCAGWSLLRGGNSNVASSAHALSVPEEAPALPGRTTVLLYKATCVTLWCSVKPVLHA